MPVEWVVITELTSLLFTNCQVTEPSIPNLKFIIGAKEVLHTSVFTVLVTPSTDGDNIVHTFSGNSSPVSHL